MMLEPVGQHEASSPRIAVTTCVAVAVPPEELVAVQVTTVRPSGNLAGRLLLSVTVPQVELTCGFTSVTLVHCEMVSSCCISVNTGEKATAGVLTFSELS